MFSALVVLSFPSRLYLFPAQWTKTEIDAAARQALLYSRHDTSNKQMKSFWNKRIVFIKLPQKLSKYFPVLFVDFSFPYCRGTLKQKRLQRNKSPFFLTPQKSLENVILWGTLFYPEKGISLPSASRNSEHGQDETEVTFCSGSAQ